MIKPTIGRVVWYWTSKEEAEEAEAQARAAIVVYVHDDYCVNLSVFDRNGDQHPLQQVPLFQGHPGAGRPDCPHCEWMPYQKGQAAKTEIPMEIFAKVETLLSEVAQLKSAVAGLRQVDLAAAEATAKTEWLGGRPKVAAGDLIAKSLTKPAGEDPRKDGTGVG